MRYLPSTHQGYIRYSSLTFSPSVQTNFQAFFSQCKRRRKASRDACQGSALTARDAPMCGFAISPDDVQASEEVGGGVNTRVRQRAASRSTHLAAERRMGEISRGEITRAIRSIMYTDSLDRSRALEEVSQSWRIRSPDTREGKTRERERERERGRK